MTLVGSGIVPNGTDFAYESLTQTFSGTAFYNFIDITPVPTGAGSEPLDVLRIIPHGGHSMFQLWTGGPAWSGSLDLSDLNGTYNLPTVDHSLLGVGSFSLFHAFGTDIGAVTLTVVAVPEPSTLSLLALGGLMLAGRRRQTRA